MKITNAYIEKREDLPEELVLGRKYFIEDSGDIIVNFGNGPVSFGRDNGPSDEVIIIGTESLSTNYNVLYINEE